MAGTPLTNIPIQSSYAGLLKTTDNLTLDGALRKVTDGMGVDSALELSTAGAKVNGTLAVTGAVTLATALPVGSGGTGLSSSPSNGQLPIGNGTGFSLAALTAGYGTTITNGSGTITPAVSLTVVNSDLEASRGITQAGSLSGDVVFSATGAPSVYLDAGKWFLTGNITVRTSDSQDEIYAQFYDVDDAAAFGGSSVVASAITGRSSLAVSGAITLAVGHTIRFKVFRVGASILDVGAGNGPSGWIQAIRIGA